MFNLQKSIPLPPIKLERLVKYLTEVVQRSPLPLEELKARGLDFGKGRGDITRFLERLGLVKVVGKNVYPTPASYELLSLHHLLGRAVFHPIFYSYLIQYKLIYNIIKEKNKVELNYLHKELNKHISNISPSSWINDVAFKTLISFGVEIGAFEKRGGEVSFLGDPIALALANAFGGALIGGRPYVGEIPEWLSPCAKPVKPSGVLSIDENCAAQALERRLTALAEQK